MGAGFDNFDIAALTARGIPLITTGSANAGAVAEHALYLLLAVARQGPTRHQAVKAGRWQRTFGAIELAGKTCLVVGMGRIGHEIARRATALDMRVIGVDPRLKVGSTGARGVELRASLEVALPEADVVVLACALTAETRGMISVWDYVLGHIPLEQERWRRFNDYYINCTRHVDLQIDTILKELDALGLAENTIIVFTSDHGEAAGAHGLHGKGPFAYQETMHLPMHIVHPDVQGGQDCQALTGHIDFVPTLLSMAGVKPGQVSEIAGQDLPGRDISAVLTNPPSADVHAVRDSVLFTYSGLVTNDHEIFKLNAEAKAAGKKPMVELIKAGYRPDMKKRGSLRTVFDGRYKFSRYFSPVERNQPKTIEELYQWNDVELFDLKNDSVEMKNLAINKSGNSKLIMTMSTKLEAIIKAEIGIDDGREMPNIPTVDWTIEKVDL